MLVPSFNKNFLIWLLFELNTAYVQDIKSGEVVSGDGMRIAKLAWLPGNKDSVLNNLVAIISSLTQLIAEFSEPFQVCHRHKEKKNHFKIIHF